jgi:transposase-like protein
MRAEHSWSSSNFVRIRGVLAEADTPEISLASVARRHDLCPQQLYAWRRLVREAAVAAQAAAPLVFCRWR